jgi:FkbM family methyltransferase
MVVISTGEAGCEVLQRTLENGDIRMTPAEELPGAIVRALYGPDTRVSADSISSAARQLASPANSPDGEVLAWFCQLFLQTYKNWNYNLEVNGERWLLKQLAPFKPAVVFDVGANVGDWLRAAREELPSAQVHAFEIVETTSEELLKRTAGQTGIVVNRFGLSDHAGTIKMRTFERSSTLATHTAYPHGKYNALECPVRRGDDYVRENKIERIDLLKLDVEGAEGQVLHGLAETLSGGQIDVIQFEYGKVAILTHFLLMDAYDLLEAKGYTVGKLYPDHVDFRAYKLEDEDFLGPNYVAVRRARSDLVEALRRR